MVKVYLVLNMDGASYQPAQGVMGRVSEERSGLERFFLVSNQVSPSSLNKTIK